MATLIKERRIAADNWQLLKRSASGELPGLPAGGDAIVPLALWLARREELLAYPGRLGGWLGGNGEGGPLGGVFRRFGGGAVK
jgi:uncharacterized protein (DUF934 family)